MNQIEYSELLFSKILLPVVLELSMEVSHLAFHTPGIKLGDNGDVGIESDDLTYQAYLWCLNRVLAAYL